jgi:hypothetical protein
MSGKYIALSIILPYSQLDVANGRKKQFSLRATLCTEHAICSEAKQCRGGHREAEERACREI